MKPRRPQRREIPTSVVTSFYGPDDGSDVYRFVLAAETYIAFLCETFGLKGKQDCEDVSQSVMLLACEMAAPTKGRVFRQWLYRTAAAAIRQKLVENNRDLLKSLADLDEIQGTSFVTGKLLGFIESEKQMKTELMKKIMLLIKETSPTDMAEVIDCIESGRTTTTEIAAATGMSDRNVRRRMKALRSEAAKQLDKILHPESAGPQRINTFLTTMAHRAALFAANKDDAESNALKDANDRGSA